MDEEKKYNSNKTPKSVKKAEYMKLTEEEEDDDVVSSSEKKDTFNINNTDSTYSNYSEYVSKNGNKINLSGKDLSTESAKILLNNLYNKFPNVTEIDMNNCNLEIFPKILLNFKKLISFDLRNNNFLDFESLAENLSTYNNLTDLKVDLVDQNQVLLILSQVPKLIFLNGKSTKEAVTIVDVDEKDIQDISLQNEVESFNDIINKLNEREEQLNNNKNNQENNKDNEDNNNESSISIFSTEFQNKLYEEAENGELPSLESVEKSEEKDSLSYKQSVEEIESYDQVFREILKRINFCIALMGKDRNKCKAELKSLQYYVQALIADNWNN